MISILLFKNFYKKLPDSFIFFLQQNCPKACCLTIKNTLDFNIWDKSLRNDEKVISAIKLYEEQYGSLNMFFKFENVLNFNGNILIDTITYEEFWEYNVRQDKSSIYSKT
jgi:hypothetical protein